TCYALKVGFAAVAFESSEGVVRDIFELGLIDENQFLEDLLLRIKMMVQAPGENAALIGYFLQAYPEAGRCDQPGRRLENLGAPRTLTGPCGLHTLHLFSATRLAHS